MFVGFLVFSFLLTLFSGAKGSDLRHFIDQFGDNDTKLSEESDKIAKAFEDEYFVYLKSGVEPDQLKLIAKDLSNIYNGREVLTTPTEDLSAANQFAVCTFCRATVNVLTRMYRDPEGELYEEPNRYEYSKEIGLTICRVLHLSTQEVCTFFFDFNWPILNYIISNSVADSRSICGNLPIRFCKAKQEEFAWSIDIDKNAEPITSSKKQQSTKGPNDLNVLHISDIHFDPLYEVGSKADCEEIMCCQEPIIGGNGTSQGAGYWGDYRDCDSPLHTIRNAFEHIKKTHQKIDYIYHTGDVVDHMIWGTSREKNQMVLTTVDALFHEFFPDVPVYSSIGNHEPHPLNVFGPDNVPEEINVYWLYKHLYTLWSKWLPADAEATVLKGGYYTVTPQPGLRVISLNNNDCYIYNWWIYYDGSIMSPQLQWLHDTLLHAEKSNEFVHILAHIPSADGDCWTLWAREYNRIIARFHHVISGIFNGHTHVDEFNVHYTTGSKQYAVGISWNGGSLTPNSRKNPNYKIYQIAPKSMEVVDFHSWIFNLTEANRLGSDTEPQWFEEYSFTKEFTEDMSPAGLDELLNQMVENPKLLRKYWRFKMTSADPRLQGGCGNGCLLYTICRMATTVNNQKERCTELQTKLEIALENETPEEEKPGDGGGGGTASLMTLNFSLKSLIAIGGLYVVMIKLNNLKLF